MYCEMYAGMADSFYRQYLAAKEVYDDTHHDSIPIIDEAQNYDRVLKIYNLNNLMEVNAIAATVFQALAIEAYINLFGVYQLGEEKFYSEYEPPKATKPKNFRYMNSLNKLKRICKDGLGKDYPEDSAVYIEELFEKRDRLVHSKPKPCYLDKDKLYNYDDPSDNYKDIEAFFDEINFVYKDIDEQMMLYKQLKENIRDLRKAEKELTEEIQANLLGNIYNAVEETIKRCFGI